MLYIAPVVCIDMYCLGRGSKLCESRKSKTTNPRYSQKSHSFKEPPRYEFLYDV